VREELMSDINEEIRSLRRQGKVVSWLMVVLSLLLAILLIVMKWGGC
jgi:hypothetical protein